MNPEWYYVRDGVRVGPRAAEEVEALFSSGLLGPETLVWTAGMERWQPASQVPAFAHLTRGPAVPPPVPGQPFQGPRFTSQTAAGLREPRTQGYAGAHTPMEDAGEVDSEPHPWRRWAARMIDVACAAILLGVLMELGEPGSTQNVDDLTANFVLLALWFPVEAMLLSTFGTTPGKHLLHIRVTNRDGTQLGLGTAFNRSFQVWMGGLGFGIPVVSFFTMIFAYNRLKREGAAYWDHALQLSVHHSRVSPVRWIIVVAVLLGLIVAAAYGAETTL